MGDNYHIMYLLFIVDINRHNGETVKAHQAQDVKTMGPKNPLSL